jgi:hypothetical protein
MIRIVIEADMTTGVVNVNGPVDEMRVMHWALGEALRVCNQRANARDDAASKGPQLFVASQLPS